MRGVLVRIVHEHQTRATRMRQRRAGVGDVEKCVGAFDLWMIEHDERSENLRARCLSRHDGADGEMTGAGDANPKQFECDAPRLECMPPGVMRRLPDGPRTSQAVFGRVSWGDER